MTVYLVGAGPGDPGLLTRRGAELLGLADVVVFDRLVSPELVALAPAGAERIDVGKRPGESGHQDEINALLVARGRTGAAVVRLKGGDPFVFGRGGEEVEALVAAGIAVEIVPGVTSAFAVPAYAGVPVTHRGLATSVTVITGHGAGGAPPEEDWEALARAGGTLVVLMGLAHRADVARRLLAGGRPPDTPVLIVEHGTTGRQRTQSTRLADLGAVVAEAPATIVVGAVAGLRLDWFEDRPLHGVTVAVTRPADRSAELVTALEVAGAVVVPVPVTTVEGPADGGVALRRSLEELGDVDWVLFTSVRAVERFMAELGDARNLAGCQVAAVGDVTAAALLRAGIRADVVPGDERAEGLVAALSRHPPARALFPRAASARPELADGLRRAGWSVTEVEAYRTVDSSPPADVLDAAASADAVVFSAPSAVDAFVAAMGSRRLPSAVVCIGPTTAEAVTGRGLVVAAVAARPDTAALVAAVAGCFADGGAHPGSGAPTARR